MCWFASPGSAAPLSDLDPAFREWLIDFGDSGYVVLYRVDDEAVTTLTIWHQRSRVLKRGGERSRPCSSDTSAAPRDGRRC